MTVIPKAYPGQRAKCMGADLGRDAGHPGAPLDHLAGVRPGQRIASELAGRAVVGLEQKRLGKVRVV